MKRRLSRIIQGGKRQFPIMPDLIGMPEFFARPPVICLSFLGQTLKGDGKGNVVNQFRCDCDDGADFYHGIPLGAGKRF